MNWDDGTISFPQKDLPTPACTEKLRSELQKQMDEFLSRGGKIKTLEPGISAEDWNALAEKLRKSLNSTAEQKKSAVRRKRDRENESS